MSSSHISHSCHVNYAWPPAYSTPWVGFCVKKLSKLWVRGPCLCISIHGMPAVQSKCSVITRIMLMIQQFSSQEVEKFTNKKLMWGSAQLYLFFQGCNIAPGIFDNVTRQWMRTAVTPFSDVSLEWLCEDDASTSWPKEAGKLFQQSGVPLWSITWIFFFFFRESENTSR